MTTPKTKDTIELLPTKLPHIFHCDIDGSGLLREVAVVKQAKDGTLYYIDIEPLHQIDKARLKRVVTAQYAKERPLWELMSNVTLSNGMNALDFFHANCVKVKRPKGAKVSQGSLEQTSTAANGSDRMIGSEFTNPAEASMDAASKVFSS